MEEENDNLLRMKDFNEAKFIKIPAAISEHIP
jgi:hypothetical protein